MARVLFIRFDLFVRMMSPALRPMLFSFGIIHAPAALVAMAWLVNGIHGKIGENDS